MTKKYVLRYSFSCLCTCTYAENVPVFQSTTYNIRIHLIQYIYNIYIRIEMLYKRWLETQLSVSDCKLSIHLHTFFTASPEPLNPFDLNLAYIIHGQIQVCLRVNILFNEIKTSCGRFSKVFSITFLFNLEILNFLLTKVLV